MSSDEVIKTQTEILRDLLEKYQAENDEPTISASEEDFRKRVSNLISVFEKTQHLWDFDLEIYSYEAIAKLALMLHKRGVHTENLSLAESLPVRLDLYNKWFNFYEDDPGYQETLDSLSRDASMFLMEHATADPQLLISACREYWSKLNCKTKYVDRSLVFLRVIESLMHSSVSSELNRSTDYNSVLSVTNLLKVASIYLHRDVYQQRSDRTTVDSRIFEQLKNDIQYLRLYLEYKTRINAYHVGYAATLESYRVKAPTEEQRKFLVTHTEDIFSSMLCACTYLFGGVDKLLDLELKSLDLISKHIRNMVKDGALDLNENLEDILAKVFQTYNMSNNRVFTEERKQFATAVDLVLAMREQFGVPFLETLPATWVVAYELLYSEHRDIRINLPRINSPAKGYHIYPLRPVARKMAQSRILIQQEGSSDVHDVRSDLLCAYFTASMHYYRSGEVAKASYTLSLTEIISHRLSETLLVYDCNECAELALEYLSAFLRFFLCRPEK